MVDKLSSGLDTVLSENGENLSGGEKQRLALARLWFEDSELVILDEATSNIDTETEALIQDSLKKMMNIGTMLIVAHRLSTIQHCDKIIVLKKGKIIESGTHLELLDKRGHYYNLYQLQYEKKN